MKVKELIELLKKHDPEKEVMIQQGEEYDYMTVHRVRAKTVYDADSITVEETIKAIVIEYQ